jgi:hypothetical protein
MIATVSVLSFAAWIYLVAFHGRFWFSGPVPGARAPSGRAKVAVVGPERDEAETSGGAPTPCWRRTVPDICRSFWLMTTVRPEWIAHLSTNLKVWFRQSGEMAGTGITSHPMTNPLTLTM